MVAAVRWHGFTINREGIKALMAKAQAVVAASPVNINKPSEVRAYVTAAMDDTEKVILEESTKKANLEAISKWGIGQMCPTCKGKGYLDKESEHLPAVQRRVLRRRAGAVRQVPRRRSAVCPLRRYGLPEGRPAPGRPSAPRKSSPSSSPPRRSSYTTSCSWPASSTPRSS